MENSNKLNIENITAERNGRAPRVYFSGIGGISMSAIAAALHEMGVYVCGSDTNIESDCVKRLVSRGIKVHKGHNAENVEGYDYFVYNARIKADNPEMRRAESAGITIIKRARMLGMLMENYETSICVTGTHGKTTATSMTGAIFTEAHTDPTFFIGAVYPPENSAYRIGGGGIFIAEADEYSDSFLNFAPDISVILNAEMDHPDYFENLDAVINSFSKFMNLTSRAVIVNGDDVNVLAAAQRYTGGGRLMKFSLKNKSADFYAGELHYTDGCAAFTLFAEGAEYARVRLGVPGLYNVCNALGAACAAYVCGIDRLYVETALAGFRGASRRFEYKGSLNGAKIYDDYAHHPTAAANAIQSARRMCGGTVWCVFQPHTYSRTKELFDDFTKALSCADKVLITDIYSASERDDLGISAADLAEKTAGACYCRSLEEAADILKEGVKANDIALIMGAGDINRLTPMLFR